MQLTILLLFFLVFPFESFLRIKVFKYFNTMSRHLEILFGTFYTFPGSGRLLVSNQSNHVLDKIREIRFQTQCEKEEDEERSVFLGIKWHELINITSFTVQFLPL